MNFLSTALGFFWRDESFAVLIMVLFLAGVLLHFRKDERKSLYNTLVFFFVCLLGQFASSLVFAMEFTRAAALLHEVFYIGIRIAESAM